MRKMGLANELVSGALGLMRAHLCTDSTVGCTAAEGVAAMDGFSLDGTPEKPFGNGLLTLSGSWLSSSVQCKVLQS